MLACESPANLPRLDSKVMDGTVQGELGEMFQLHSFCLSSASWRVRIGLGLKGVKYEYVSVHLRKQQQNEPAYAALNAMQQVPTLVLPDGRCLTQSVAILEWLEQTYPEPSLLPQDPFLRAKTRAVVEMVNSGIQPLMNTGVVLQLNAQGVDASRFVQHFVGKGVHALERTIRETAGKYCVGDQITLADLFVIPQLAKARDVGVDLSACPTLTGVEAAASVLDAFVMARPQEQPDFPLV